MALQARPLCMCLDPMMGSTPPPTPGQRRNHVNTLIQCINIFVGINLVSWGAEGTPTTGGKEEWGDGPLILDRGEGEKGKTALLHHPPHFATEGARAKGSVQ